MLVKGAWGLNISNRSRFQHHNLSYSQLISQFILTFGGLNKYDRHWSIILIIYLHFDSYFNAVHYHYLHLQHCTMNYICWQHADFCHSNHYPVHPPTQPWSHKGHCHEWSTRISSISPSQHTPPPPFSQDECYFKLWPWKFKVKVMSVVKEYYCKVV